MSQSERKRRQSVAILFCEPNAQIRSGLRQALRHEGYERILDIDSEPNLSSHLSTASSQLLPDLAILDADLGPGMVPMLRDVRRGLIGINPFFSIILTTANTEVARIRQLIGSGVDEVVAKPLAPATILQRMELQATRRKPYVATGDYIGPDRREGRPDPNAPGVRLIDPPNTFKAKLDGKPISIDALKRMVRDTQGQLIDQRVDRDVRRIMILTRALAEASVGSFTHNETEANELRGQCNQLIGLAALFARHAAHSPMQNTVPLFEALQSSATILRDHLPALDERSAHLLLPIAAKIVDVLADDTARRHVAAGFLAETGATRHAAE